MTTSGGHLPRENVHNVSTKMGIGTQQLAECLSMKMFPFFFEQEGCTEIFKK